MSITKRYIHQQERTIREATERASVAEGGHSAARANTARQSRAKLRGEMPQETKSTETATSLVRFPKGFVPLPPVSMDDLKRDTEHDPEGAEEFVASIRALRQSDSRTVTL